MKAGSLNCDISGGFGLIIGSQRTLNCSFAPTVPGPVEFYVGTLTKFGLDLGVTTGVVMVWLVYAPTNRPAGALAGSYGGATAEASVVAGVGANVLVGGSNRTVELQPVSLHVLLGYERGAYRRHRLVTSVTVAGRGKRALEPLVSMRNSWIVSSPG